MTDEIKQRATVEDLLGLSVKGWEQIATMDDHQLAEYLSEITKQEPDGINPESQPNGYEIPKAAKTKKAKKGKDSADLENEIDDNPNNPITSVKAKKKQKSIILNATADEFDNLL